jgi:hypothetical protein
MCGTVNKIQKLNNFKFIDSEVIDFNLDDYTAVIVNETALCTCTRFMYLHSVHVLALGLCTCTRFMYLHSVYVLAFGLCTCIRFGPASSQRLASG